MAVPSVAAHVFTQNVALAIGNLPREARVAVAVIVAAHVGVPEPAQLAACLAALLGVVDRIVTDGLAATIGITVATVIRQLPRVGIGKATHRERCVFANDLCKTALLDAAAARLEIGCVGTSGCVPPE